MLDPRAVADIICITKSGKLVGIMLAVPCNSCSAARRAPIGSKMPRRLGSDAYPLGLPQLIEADRKVTGVGNDILSAVVRIIKARDESGTPWVLESPRSSFLWKMPAVRRLLLQSHVRLQHCHQYQYGCPSMQATSFMSGNCQAAPQLERVCRPVKRRFCSRTGCPHFTPDNPSVTKQAQTYSPQLASALAAVFKDACFANHIGRAPSAFCGKRKHIDCA
jgi:hypothetical protein